MIQLDEYYYKKTSELEKKINEAFYYAIILAFVLTWLPFKSIGYFMPYISLLIFLLIANDNQRWYLSVMSLLSISFFVLLHFLLRTNFLLHSGLLTLITYGAIIVCFILPSRNYLSSLKTFNLYIRLVKKIIIIQSIVGIIQLILGMNIRQSNLDSDTGDVVQGTIHIFSFLPESSMGFGNQMFVINILLLITFIVPSLAYKKSNIVAILFGFTAVMVASVLHLTASWLAALFTIFFLFNPNIFNRYFIVLIIVAIFSIGTIIYTQPENYNLIERYITEYLSGESLKVLATYQAVVEMPKEFLYTHVIGVGPGQFSSKAGLIGTGQYFGDFYNPTPIPFLPQAISDPFQKYGYSLWEYTNKPDIVKWINGTMNRTFYSALSLYTELGAIVFAVILFFFLKAVLFFRKCYNCQQLSKQDKTIALCAAVNITFIFFICFFENYLETPQAIFSGILLIKLSYGYLKYQSLEIEE